MKSICVSMSSKEAVLDSYLIRVFDGSLEEKPERKVIRFPEESLQLKNWTVQMFKNFCESCVSDKRVLRIYKARLVPKKEVPKVE